MADPEMPFSKREGHAPSETPITIREGAPENLRYALLDLSLERFTISPTSLRTVICGVLRTRPDPSNWSEYPNIWGEVEGHIYSCEWYYIYDFAEAVYALLKARRPRRCDEFEAAVNALFREMGIGWQMIDGLIVTRGDDAFEAVQQEAVRELSDKGLTTASAELNEAIRDLSRRPEPDLSGAVQHAMAALESVARELSGDAKRTLGEIIKNRPGLIPRPLDESISKMWGYASNEARHGKEGRLLTREESQLVVGVSAVVSAYLSAKISDSNEV